MHIYKKNGHWQFEVMIRGKRYHRAIPEATSKKEAEEYVTIFKSDLLRNRLDLAENIGRKPLSTLIDLYKDYANNNLRSNYSVIKIAERFDKIWGNKLICDITPNLIEKYKKKRLNTVYHSKIVTNKQIDKYISPDTVNRELGVLSKMFSLAIINKYAKENPVREVKKLPVPNRIERHLTPEEEKRIMQVCDGDYSFMHISKDEEERLRKKYHESNKHMKAIISTALYTGMRKSEILKLSWDCVDLEKKELTILNPKNGKTNILPLSDRLYNLLLELKQKEPHSEYVFTNPKTGTCYKDIHKNFQTVLELAGVENFRFHDFRHTSATRLVDLGIPLPVVQKILNHQKIQTTMRYTHIMQTQELDALEKLSKYTKED